MIVACVAGNWVLLEQISKRQPNDLYIFRLGYRMPKLQKCVTHRIFD